MALRQIIESGLPLVYVNQLGGQDELVFDGGSFAFNGDKSLAFQLAQFEQAVTVTEWKRASTAGAARPVPSSPCLIWKRLITAPACWASAITSTNGFKSVVLGLSGGIDSAVCAAMAVDALGADRVRTVMLPYHYTSGDSLKDAAECARALGCRYETVPIAEPVEGFLSALADTFEGTEKGITEENLQSRTRGTI